jgi:hypothetical protein
VQVVPGVVVVVVRALRRVDEQLVRCPGRSDLEEALFFVDSGGAGQDHVAGQCAVYEMCQVHAGHSSPLAEWIVEIVR